MSNLRFGMTEMTRRFELLPLITEALEPPPPSFRRQGSIIQLCPEARTVNYGNSTFPSLIQTLGPNTRIEHHRRKVEQPRGKEEKKPQKLRKRKLSRSTSYVDNLRRRNENRWSRIEELVKEKVDAYERYAEEMEQKVARQRQEIRRKTQQTIENLARLEEQKKQERLFHSPYGKMWRHHRSLQRRALDLEPMTAPPRGPAHTRTTDLRDYPHNYIMSNFLNQLPLKASD